MQTTLGPQHERDGVAIPAQRAVPAWFLSLANALLSVLSVALCFIDSGPLTWLAGAALALALPGDALRRALDVSRTGVSAAIFTVATSLSLTVFIGLAVDQLSAGITARTMAIGLLAVAVVADAVALARARPTAARPADPEPIDVQPIDVQPGGSLTWKHFALCALAFAIPAAAGLTLSVRASQHHDATEAGTALSIVQQGTTAVVEVIEAAPGQHSYAIEVSTGDQELLQRTLMLGTGMQVRIPVDISRLSISTQVVAQLTQAGSATPFRTVSLVRRRP